MVSKTRIFISAVLQFPLTIRFPRLLIQLLPGIVCASILLLLAARFINIQKAATLLSQNLMTPRGGICAVLSGVAFLSAFILRGLRWKLFVCQTGPVSSSCAIKLTLLSTFLNFLLPVRGGEIVRCLTLKRLTAIPLSHSLPTVALDKMLDLLPACLLVILLPLAGIQPDIRLLLVMGLGSSLLCALIILVIATRWHYARLQRLVDYMTSRLPRTVGERVRLTIYKGIATLVQALERPVLLLPALFLTLAAMLCDGLFAMLAFWTIGEFISPWTAILGYTIYNLFYLLPTPPGQVGSNEAIGLLVFTGLLGLNADAVMAMFLFSHPWAAVLMSTSGIAAWISLRAKKSQFLCNPASRNKKDDIDC